MPDIEWPAIDGAVVEEIIAMPAQPLQLPAREDSRQQGRDCPARRAQCPQGSELPFRMAGQFGNRRRQLALALQIAAQIEELAEIGRASCRERV